MNSKILVAAPVYEKMDYVIDDFINSINKIEGIFEFILVDNSDSEDFCRKIFEKGIKCIKIKREKGMQSIIKSRNKILDYAVENDFDYVLMMDADVLPPKNILNELLKANKEIISGVYLNYFKVNGSYKVKPVAWKSLSEKEFEEIKKKFKLPPEVKSKEDLRAHLTEEEWKSGKIHKVMICSAGCMLLKRDVFKNVKYGLMDIPEKYQTSDDVYFFNEARKKGFKIYCHTGIKCAHKIKGKFIKEGNSFVNPAYR
jgi:GT2 family glycosyltransferase